MSPDIIIGAGIGGASLATALAPSGARALILAAETRLPRALADCLHQRVRETPAPPSLRHLPDEGESVRFGGRFRPEST